MEIKILKCDVLNGNNLIYPLEEVKKCIKNFNKTSKDDPLRNVHFGRLANSMMLIDGFLGKIKNLKIKKDKILYADFEFGEHQFAKQCKEFYDECVAKGVSTSNFDYRIMMDCLGEVDQVPNYGYSKVRDLEVHQFCFGLDSCWRCDEG